MNFLEEIHIQKFKLISPYAHIVILIGLHFHDDFSHDNNLLLLLDDYQIVIGKVAHPEMK